MTHYYLARYVGTGTEDDPFRPAADEAPTWSSIDLRPDSKIITGRSLLSVDGDQLPASANRVYLGNDLDAPSNAVKSALEQRLGVMLDSVNLRNMIAELLIVHARKDGTRWRPLVASDKRMRIWLGALIYDVPVIAGGAAYNESFNKANSAILGPDLIWTDILGDAQVVSNRAETTTAGATARSRAEHDTVSDDQYVTADVRVGTPSTSSCNVGVLSRYSSSADTAYRAVVQRTSVPADSIIISKVVAAAQTTLNTTSVTWPSTTTDTLNFETVGSSLSTFQSSTPISSITDTSIASGKRAGINILAGTAATRTTTYIESFGYGDKASTASIQSRQSGAWPRKPFSIRVAGAWVGKPTSVRKGGGWQPV